MRYHSGVAQKGTALNRERGPNIYEIHPYPAKFPGDVARAYIEEFSRPGEVILDPFCGSGTTLVEARTSGRKAIGVDVHPIAVLLSRVKTLSIAERDAYEVEFFADAIGSALERAGILKQQRLWGLTVEHTLQLP